MNQSENRLPDLQSPVAFDLMTALGEGPVGGPHSPPSRTLSESAPRQDWAQEDVVAPSITPGPSSTVGRRT